MKWFWKRAYNFVERNRFKITWAGTFDPAYEFGLALSKWLKLKSDTGYPPVKGDE
jgi:hypothetical protein